MTEFPPTVGYGLFHGSWEVDKYVRFMPVVRAYADMAKVPGTHVGAAVYGQRHEPLTSGWNGAPRRCKADVDARSDDRETKLLWVCHAEANAIANAAAAGTALLGSTMLVTLMPCMACAKLIVQAGIIRVICPRPDMEMEEKWSRDFQASRALFRECMVDLIEIDNNGESE